MQSERETKTVTTPSGREVVIKTYLTGREKREISNASIPKNVNYSGHTESISDLNVADIMNAGEDAALKNIIISIDGNTEGDFVAIVLDMKSEDSDVILAAVKEIADGLTIEKKTT